MRSRRAKKILRVVENFFDLPNFEQRLINSIPGTSKKLSSSLEHPNLTWKLSCQLLSGSGNKATVCEADHSPPSTAAINEWNSTSAPSTSSQGTHRLHLCLHPIWYIQWHIFLGLDYSITFYIITVSVTSTRKSQNSAPISRLIPKFPIFCS